LDFLLSLVGRDAAEIALTGRFLSCVARDGDENLKTEVRTERLTRAALGHDRPVGGKKCSIHTYVWAYRPDVIPIQHRIVEAVSSDCFEEFGYEYGGCNAHHCGALMELIEDGLRQDDLPLSCVFPAKANFQLATPDAKGANRPSHSVCDFPIIEALLDKGGNQCRICLAFSQVVTGSSCPAPCLSLHTTGKSGSRHLSKVIPPG
jgi:hypothetical protein